MLGDIINGIENLGSTCFANCILQQLANIPEFTDMILKYPIDLDKPEDYDYADDLLCQLQVAFRNLRGNIYQPYYPVDFFRTIKQNKKFINLQEWADQQQDPHLFMINLLDQLEEFHSRAPKIQKIIFGGTQNEITFCR